MQHATLIKTDGTERRVSSKGKEFSLEELQKLVGGYIEKPLPNLVIDEEGRLKLLAPNYAASKRAGFNIVGSALFID